MTHPKNLAAEIPPDHPADYYIGREVLLCGHTGCSNNGGQPVNRDPGSRAGVFMRDYAGD